jgi:hypothetical protein
VAASTEIVIGDVRAQHVLIRAVSRSNPGLFDYRDANWIVCEVEIAAGGFHGRFSADLRSEEFHAFLDQILELERTVDGAATFATMEGQVALSLTGVSDGGVRVAGEAVDSAGDGNRLTFGFDIDRGGVPQISRSLGDLLAAYPVLEAPET